MSRPILPFLLFTLGLLCPCEGETIVPTHSRKFIRYDNCVLVPTPSADGDSFRVRIAKDEFVFRLYYVDCPEADNRFPERNSDHAGYFGITDAESVAAGQAARKFVKEQLTGRPFTVFTRWLTVGHSGSVPYYYAVVEVDGRGLAELLVENGLARLHGTSATHPNGTKASAYIAKLLASENSARANKRGAWANTRPGASHPNLQLTEERHEMPRGLERSLFAVLGAAVVGAAWMLTSLQRRIRAALPSDNADHPGPRP